MKQLTKGYTLSVAYKKGLFFTKNSKMKIQNIFILLGISESSLYRFTLPPGSEIECKLAFNVSTYAVGGDS